MTDHKICISAWFQEFLLGKFFMYYLWYFEKDFDCKRQQRFDEYGHTFIDILIESFKIPTFPIIPLLYVNSNFHIGLSLSNLVMSAYFATQN